MTEGTNSYVSFVSRMFLKVQMAVWTSELLGAKYTLDSLETLEDTQYKNLKNFLQHS